jgi:hypothetical protein
LTITSRSIPEVLSDSSMSSTIAISVRALMLTVPAKLACSCEQEIVIGGRANSG